LHTPLYALINGNLSIILNEFFPTLFIGSSGKHCLTIGMTIKKMGEKADSAIAFTTHSSENAKNHI
jgi:hypothetical protein